MDTLTNKEVEDIFVSMWEGAAPELRQRISGLDGGYQAAVNGIAQAIRDGKSR